MRKNNNGKENTTMCALCVHPYISFWNILNIIFKLLISLQYCTCSSFPCQYFINLPHVTYGHGYKIEGQVFSGWVGSQMDFKTCVTLSLNRQWKMLVNSNLLSFFSFSFALLLPCNKDMWVKSLLLVFSLLSCNKEVP